MKLLMSLIALIFSFNSLTCLAQGHETGGGELDPTKKNHKVNFKKAEKAFRHSISENWKRCGFSKDSEVPKNFVSFYLKFKDEKYSIDPKDLVDPDKALCADCLQQKLKAKEGGNFLCLIHNEVFQQVLYAISHYTKNARDYMKDDIQEYVKDNKTKQLNANDITDFYEKFLIDYE